jgi:hypothetical protein
MRLWSIHPKYLDTKGLVALWREGLLAQAVLSGKTKGYKNHPQLERFNLETIGQYLPIVWLVATSRGYSFDGSKIRFPAKVEHKINITQGQLEYEFEHLQKKLDTRDINTAFDNRLDKAVFGIDPHPLFTLVPGPIESWEKLPNKTKESNSEN